MKLNFKQLFKSSCLFVLTVVIVVTPTQISLAAEGSGIPIGKPQPPASVTLPSPVYASNATTTDLNISWAAIPDSDNGGSAVTGYSAVAMVGSTPSPATCSVQAPTVSCTLVGLNFSTTYTIKVTATNAIGTSDARESASFTTPSVAQTVTITGNPGSVNFGAADTQLSATATSGLPITWTTTSTSVCTVSNNGLVHYIGSGSCVIVATQDGSGSSYTSDSKYVTIEVSSTLTATASGASNVTGSSATLAGSVPFGGSNISVNFCISLNDSNSNCSAISGTALSSASPSTITSTSGSTTSSTISGLTGGLTYFYWVEANNGSTTVKSSTSSFQTLIAPTLTKSGPDTGQADSYFSTSLTAASGSGVYTTWSADVLPAGLSLSPSGSSATISGTPTTAGSTTSVITVIDSSNLSASLSITFAIAAAPVITPPPSTVIDTTVDNSPPVLSPEERARLEKEAAAAEAKRVTDLAAKKAAEELAAKIAAEEDAIRKAAEAAAAKKAADEQAARVAAAEEARLGNPPGSTTPILSPDGTFPTITLSGTAIVLIEGKQFIAELKVINSEIIQITFGSQILKFSVLGLDGLPRTLALGQPITALRNDEILFEGEGFLKGTNVTIWIFSTPIMLGAIPVDEAGKFSGKLVIPTALELGAHTIQINGLDVNKKSFSLSSPAFVSEKIVDPIDQAVNEELGNQVGPGYTAPAYGKTITKGVLFTKNSSKLVIYEKKIILIYRKLLTKRSTVTCVGFTYSKKPSKSELAIAKAQAKVVCAFLMPAKTAKYKVLLKDIKSSKKTGRRTSATKKYPVNIQITTPKKA